MKNFTQLKQYKNMILRHILSSQFIYSALHQECELKKQKFFIHSKKAKNIHYLYLFLTTNKRPYAKKYDISPKNSNKNSQQIKTKSKSVTWSVEIKKRNLYDMISYMSFQIIPSQNISEKKVLKLQKNKIDLIISHAPLTNRTMALKSKNGYIPDIPLIWRLTFTNSSLFQKIFILKHLRILNQDVKFKRLENVVE